jgi:hypothetical protein
MPAGITAAGTPFGLPAAVKTVVLAELMISLLQRAVR